MTFLRFQTGRHQAPLGACEKEYGRPKETDFSKWNKKNRETD